MRKLGHLLMIAAIVFAASCKKDDTTPSKDNTGKDDQTETPVNPSDPSAPVVVSATLTGANGEKQVQAGQLVKFSASFSSPSSELYTYSVEIYRGTDLLYEYEKPAKPVVEETISLNLIPSSVTEDFYPVVKVSVSNTDELFTEKTLENKDVCQICAVTAPKKFYLVSDGVNVEMQPVAGQAGVFKTSGSLEGIGSTLTIAEKVTESGAVDNTGRKWDFPTPSTGSYGLAWIKFDYYAEKITKCLDHVVELNCANMATEAAWAGLPYANDKVSWSIALVKDCQVKFVNFPSGLQLQADRFEDVSGNIARYTGHDCNYEVWYSAQFNWLIMHAAYDAPANDFLWLAGENASLPMSPYCQQDYSIAWFPNYPQHYYESLLVKTDNNNWRCLLYMKNTFAVKLYNQRAWAGEVTGWSSSTPEYIVISEPDPNGGTDGCYGNSGPSFTEGLWMLEYNTLTKKVKLSKYNGSIPTIQ